MSRHFVRSGYAYWRIEYQAKAVALVWTTMQRHATTSAAAEIDVTVFHSSWNQPLMSQPSRLAAAPITTTSSAKFRSRRHRGRGRLAGAS